MTEVHPSTLRVAHQFLTRFAAGDATALARLFAPRVDWRASVVAGAPWPEEVRTPREVEGFFWALFDTLRLESFGVQRLHVDGEDAVVLAVGQYRVPSTGREFAQHFAVSLAVRGDQIDRLWLYEDTLAVADGLGLVG